MEDGGVAVFMLFFAAFIVAMISIAIAHQYKTNETLRRVYSRLALHYRGDASLGGFNQRPSLQFTHGGAPIVVDTFRTGGKHPRYYIQLHAPWRGLDSRGTPFRMAVYPESLWATVGKFLGVKDIAIGDRSFDNRYTITGSDEAAIGALLSPSARGIVDALRLIEFNNDIYVSTGAGQLLIKKLGSFRTFDAIVEFITLSLTLYDLMLGAQGEGITFLDPINGDEKTGDAPTEHDWECQVCGEGIAGDVVFCRSCQTPHHKDCWEYNGVCSTYGCRETRFVSKNAARTRGAAS